MNLPTSELIPEDPNRLPPARRRRAHRLLAPLDVDERAALLDDLAHRASPSFDFFLFSLATGIVLGLGLILDSPALLVLGALLAPLMAPAVGISLGTVIGSMSHFLRSLGGLLVGSLLVFMAGLVTGSIASVINRMWLPLALTQAHHHAQLSWPNFLVLAVGAGFTAATIAHRERNPAIPSIALAYELYLPAAIAGFGLAGRFPHMWPDGLVVFTIHLAWSALAGALVFALLGYRPPTIFGYSLSGAVGLLGIILLIGLGGAGAAWGGQIALPTPIPSITPTITLSATVTVTPLPPTLTPSITPTISPSPTITQTPMPSPTPRLADVAVLNSEGALLRSEPEGEILGSYINGTTMQRLPEARYVNGILWVKVITPDRQEGWMMLRLLVTATPGP